MEQQAARRIRPLTRDEAHPDAWRFFDQDEERFGMVLNPTGVYAHRPPIQAAARGLSRSVATDPVLPAELRYLVCLRIATLVGCQF